MREEIKSRIISKLLSLQYRAYPIKSKELEAEYGVSSSEIRDIVREMRELGYPITSSGDGYGYAKSYEEIKPTLLHLKSRALSMLSTIKKLENNFIKPDSNPDLFRESVIDDIIESIKQLYKL